MRVQKTILVCGATGFIGRNAATYFAADPDYRVIAVAHSRPPFENPDIAWVQADLTIARDVDRVTRGVDVILQFAAVTSGAKDIVQQPHIHITDTVIMNSLLLRAAHEKGVQHFVFPSCSIMYRSREEPHDEESFSEADPLEPRYFPAAWSKIYIEKMCAFFAGLGRTRFSVLRHTNLYGPHDKFDLERSHVFGATVAKVMTAKESVTVWGEGTEARDLLYVDDFIRLVELLLKKQTAPYEMLCVGVGFSCRIKDLVARVVAASGRSLSIVYDKSKPTIPTSLSLSYGKAKQLYGWEPKVDLDEGIRRTLAWWKEHLGKRAQLRE